MTDLIRRADALALPHRLSPSLDADDGYYVSVDAIRTLPAVTVGVKPLVWEDFGDWGAKASAYYQANYLIQFWKGRGQFEVALSYPGYQTGFDGERWHPTLDAAKAAAQRDYEQRILAALEPAAVDASQPADPAVNAPEMRLETVSENIARDMRDGRFPDRSEPQMVPVEPAPDPAAIREAKPRIIPMHTQSMYGVCIGGRWDGWVMVKHPDGYWVSHNKPDPVDPSIPDFAQKGAAE